MEGTGLGIAHGCLVHVDVDVNCIVGCCNAIAAEHGRYGHSCMQ